MIGNFWISYVGMEYYSDEDFDKLLLTQVPSIESQRVNFGVIDGNVEDEDNLFHAIFGEVEERGGGLVSLEDTESNNRHSVLYDNVMAEDISSDEELRNM